MEYFWQLYKKLFFCVSSQTIKKNYNRNRILILF